jgi:phospholipid/cholesterol/gamma-HCH transport system substrate-binding protein
VKRRDEVLVGVLLTVATIIGILGTIWLVRGGLHAGYPLYARFPWGAGLKQGQPVVLAGVSVGYVADAQLEPNGTLLVTLRVQSDYHVPSTATAKLVSVGFFGDQSVALIPPLPLPAHTTYYAPGDTVPPGIPEVTIGQVLGRVDSISLALGSISGELDAQLVQAGGIRDIRATLANTNKLVTQLSAVAAEQNANLSKTFVQLRHTAAAIDSATIDSTLKNFQTTSANVAALTDSLRATSVALNATLAKLQRGEGTAGKLLSDTLLYSDLRHLVTRVDSLTLDFKANPRKYINLKIF